MLWLAFTLLAAFAQAWRNAFQKQLSQHVPVLGTTLARFLLAWPLALAYLAVLYNGDSSLTLPQFPPAFFAYIVATAVMQISGTMLMVRLFHLKNFAIGIGLVRSEAIFAAIVGVAFYGSQLQWLGWLGVMTGAVAVLLLSATGNWRQLSLPVLLLGLSSGLCFALTSLWVREATLLLALPSLVAAAWALFCVIFFQALVLILWLLLRERDTLRKLLDHKRLMFLSGFASFLGSLGWFSAFSLQDVAIVKTVGQIEILFVLAIYSLIFKEKLKKQNGFGLALIVLAAMLVIWG